MSKITVAARRVGHGVVTTDLTDVGRGVATGAQFVGDYAVGFKNRVASKVSRDPDAVDEALEAVLAVDEDTTDDELLAVYTQYMHAFQALQVGVEYKSRKWNKNVKRAAKCDAQISAHFAELDIDPIELTIAVLGEDVAQFATLMAGLDI